MATFLSRLTWRNATKLFDEKNRVSDEHLNKILEAIRFAPTSYGLQPFFVKVVVDPHMKKTLQAAAWGQAQFPTSTAILVFVARTDVANRVEELLSAKSQGNPQTRAALADFEKMLGNFATGLSSEQASAWAQKQCYIALGFGLAACAELGIDSCPMEGFERQQFNTILGLPPEHQATVVLAIGRAHPEFKPFEKFRFASSDLFRFV